MEYLPLVTFASQSRLEVKLYGLEEYYQINLYHQFLSEAKFLLLFLVLGFLTMLHFLSVNAQKIMGDFFFLSKFYFYCLFNSQIFYLLPDELKVHLV